MIKEKILDLIAESTETVTPSDLEKRATGLFSAKRKEVKEAVKSLISERQLDYACIHGRTVLIRSFNRPVPVSDGIFLKPSGIPFTPNPGDTLVELIHGASFGTGEHPSTRLAIRGIAYMLKELGLSEKNPRLSMLDIGTGSGVLAITALRLGAEKALGLDSDPCAVYEARANAELNGFEDRFHVCGTELEDIKEQFDLIAANLRYPTLKTIASLIAERIRRKGLLVLSGIKSEETSDLSDVYTRSGFCSLWEAHEKNWAGLAFVKTGERRDISNSERFI